MRMLAIIVNCLALVLGLLLFLAGEMENERATVVFFAFLPLIIINLVALVFGGYGGWLRLYFKRKALQEKKMIDALTNPTETEDDEDK